MEDPRDDFCPWAPPRRQHLGGAVSSALTGARARVAARDVDQTEKG